MQFPGELRRSRETWIDHSLRLERLAGRDAYSGLHYRIQYRLVDAADYGVPQRRERLFIVGFRSDVPDSRVFPLATHSRAALFADIVELLFWL